MIYAREGIDVESVRVIRAANLRITSGDSRTFHSV
jgi:hypothetical protein